MSFYEFKKKYENFDFQNFIHSLKNSDIENVIKKDDISEFDFLKLLSPKALDYIELIAQKARDTAIRHFGKTILLYAPLYVSNFCVNNCVYCGFSSRNNIKREVLSFEQIEENCKIAAGYGIRHILLVCGESPVKTSLDYLEKTILILKKYFDCVDIEIYPLDEYGYKRLRAAGAEGLTIYQETYDEKLYKILHTRGAKADYRYRLETCERAGKAGYRNLNIGALLGLNDFVSEIFFTAVHAKYLQKNFPSCEIGISFPRLRPAAGGYQPKTVVNDKQLVLAVCAIRLFINRINIAISTRENHNLRENLIPLGITKMSAGSKTDVGGYVNSGEGQFKINDSSSVEKVKEMIYKKGYQPILKDWMHI
jgi:2-iminoacetate synthase